MTAKECDWTRPITRGPWFVVDCQECDRHVEIRRSYIAEQFGGSLTAYLGTIGPCGQAPPKAFPMLKAADPKRLHATMGQATQAADGGPTMTRRFRKWTGAVKRWKDAGSPVRSQERIEEIHATHCRPCPHFTEKQTCDLCGCRVRNSGKAWLNKIAMGTERCEGTPCRWEADVTAPAATS